MAAESTNAAYAKYMDKALPKLAKYITGEPVVEDEPNILHALNKNVESLANAEQDEETDDSSGEDIDMDDSNNDEDESNVDDAIAKEMADFVDYEMPDQDENELVKAFFSDNGEESDDKPVQKQQQHDIFAKTVRALHFDAMLTGKRLARSKDRFTYPAKEEQQMALVQSGDAGGTYGMYMNWLQTNDPEAFQHIDGWLQQHEQQMADVQTKCPTLAWMFPLMRGAAIWMRVPKQSSGVNPVLFRVWYREPTATVGGVRPSRVIEVPASLINDDGEDGSHEAVYHIWMLTNMVYAINSFVYGQYKTGGSDLRSMKLYDCVDALLEADANSAISTARSAYADAMKWLETLLVE